MPKVPTLQPGSVSTQRLQDIQVPTQAPVGAFGGGPALENNINQSLQLGQVAKRVIQEEKQRADDIVTTNYHTKAMKLKNDLKFGEKGYTKLKGEDVVNSDFVQNYQDAWNKGTQELDKMLKNSEQRLFASRIKGQLGNEHMRGLQNHFAVETSAYEIDSKLQNIEVMIEDARRNPTNDKINDFKEKTLAHYIDIERINGRGEDWIKNQYDKKISDFHVGRLNDLLSSKAHDVANEYFKDNKSEILSDDRRRMRELVEQGNIKSEGYKRGKDLFDKGVNLSALQSELDKIKNDDVRDETKKQYLDRFNLQQAAEKEAIENNYRSSYNKAISAKSMDVLSVQELSLLNDSQRKNIEKEVERVKQGIPIETNWSFYSNLRSEAVNNPNKFLSRSEIDIRTKLADAEYKQYLNIRDDLQKGGNGDLGDGFLSKNQIFEISAVRDFKLSKGSKQYDELRREVDRREKNLANTLKRDVNDDEFQGILDRLRTNVESDEDNFNLGFLDNLFFAYGLERRKLKDLKVGASFRVRFKDIPQREQIRIGRVLIRQNIQPTEELIEQVFTDTVKRASRIF